jgi:hypothetical protein
MNRIPIVILTIIYLCESSGTFGSCDTLPALCMIGRGYLVFRENGCEWAFRYTGTAIDASVWVNVVKWPL